MQNLLGESRDDQTPTEDHSFVSTSFKIIIKIVSTSFKIVLIIPSILKK